MRLIFAFMIFAIILSGCETEESIPAPDADEYISEGWKEYTAGNYEDAVAKFQEALKEDPNNSEAYNGIGWAKARSGQIDLSISNFKVAVERNPASADSHAGLAGAYLADKDYERAIASAKLVLTLNPKYKSHHEETDVNDIRVLLAICYYNIGDYASAKAQMVLLGVSDKLLDPGSPTYLLDLLFVIEEFAEKIGLAHFPR